MFTIFYRNAIKKNQKYKHFFYYLPKINTIIQHVVVHAVLSDFSSFYFLIWLPLRFSHTKHNPHSHHKIYFSLVHPLIWSSLRLKTYLLFIITRNHIYKAFTHVFFFSFLHRPTCQSQSTFTVLLFHVPTTSQYYIYSIYTNTKTRR